MATVTARPGPSFHTAPGLEPSVTDAAPSVPRGPTAATLNFYKAPADGSIPYNYVEKPPEGVPQRNYSDSEEMVFIQDLRGKESSFNLDTNAFAALQGYPHNPAIDWNDDESIKKHYYPEVERVLRENIPGNPETVFLFDHTIRRKGSNRTPVTRAHIDQTAEAAKRRVKTHLPEQAEEIYASGKRYRIINVWRPLNGTVESDPLTFANSATVSDDDIVPVEHRYPHMTGYTAAIKNTPDQQWWYWSGMDNDERLLLQCFDSQQLKSRVPHSAFVHPGSTEQSKSRESIEVRALIIG